MNNFKSKKIKITTLTPLLITQENEPTGLAYYAEGSKMIRVNFEKLIDRINYPSERNVVERIVENIRCFINNGRNTEGDLRKVLERTGKENLLSEFAEYSLENHSNYKPRLMSDTKITAKTAGKPYIPGSSIKGAIHTALISKRKESQIEKLNYYEICNLLKPERGGCFGFRDSLPASVESLFFSNLATFAPSTVRPNPKIFIYSPNKNAQKSNQKKEFKEQQKAVAFCEAVKPGKVFHSEILFREEYNVEDKKDILDEIRKAVLKKSTFVVESEIKFFNSILASQETEKEQIRELISIYKCLEKRLKEKELVLRLGAGSGFKSVSSLFCKEIENKGNLLDRALPNKTPGKTGRPINRKDLSVHEKIKSRLFVKFNDYYQPLGWIKLDLDG